MGTEINPPPPAPPRRRWLRRCVWTLISLVLLLLIFYRPLITTAARYFGRRAATAAGMKADWTLEGNFLNGVQLHGVSVTGDATALIHHLSIADATLEYDLAALRTHGVGAVLKAITVDHLTADIDLTNPSPVPTAPPPSEPSAPLPAVQMPRVHITHVNLKIHQPQGLVELEDFSVIIDPNTPGIISWQKLAVPGLPPLGPMQGTTHATAQSFSFENLNLRQDLLIQQLSVDLASLATEQLPITLALRQGGSQLHVATTLQQWSHDLSAQADASLTDLHPADLTSWGVPLGGISWGVKSLHFTAHGPVLKPAELTTTLDFTADPIVLPTLTVSALTCHADTAHGQAQTTLDAAVGANVLHVTGHATLPPAWANVAAAVAAVDFKLDARALAELSPQLIGTAFASGHLDVAAQQLRAAQATLTSKDLRVAGVPIASIDANLHADHEILTLDRAQVVWNEQNQISATGTLGLSGPQAFSARWEAACRDLASIPADIRPGSLWPSAGTIHSTGTASGTLPADLSALQAEAHVEAAGVKLNDATLQSLHAAASLHAGLAELSEFTVQLDADNAIHAEGTVELGKRELPLAAKLKVTLPNVAALSVWGEPFGAPKLEQGSVQLAWEASGSLQPMNLNGDGTAEINALKISTVPETLGLTATLQQRGDTASVPALAVTAGPWRAAGALAWHDARLEVSTLEAWREKDLLATVQASVPLDYQTQPLSLTLDVPSLDLSKLGQSLPVRALVSLHGQFAGTLATLQGQVKTDVTQIKVTDPLEPGTLHSTISLTQGKLTSQSVLTQSPLQPIQLETSLPLDIPALQANPQAVSSLPLRAHLRLPESSLAFLPRFVPTLREVTGHLAVDAEVTGTVAQPLLHGSIKAEVPSAAFVATNLPGIKDVHLDLAATGDRVTFTKATAMLSGGRVEVTGHVGLADLKNPALNVNVQAEEVLLMRDDTISQRANADLHCQGTLAAATVLGKVSLVRGRVFKEIELLPLSLPNSLPPPPASTTLGKNGPPSLPPPLDTWKFGIAVQTGDPIRLLGNLAHGNVLVDLNLAGTGAQPELTGHVTLEEAWLKLPFSRLNLTSSVISFLKEKPFDPQVEMLGESVVGNYLVTLNVSGRALDPKLRFASSPPLAEGDITYLLATGTTASDLGASNGEAAGRAMFLLFQSAYRKMFPKLAESIADQESPRLSFELSGFGNDPSRRGVAAVYEVNPKVKVVGRVGETGGFRGLLYYLIRFR